jgi:voltage-gated potassium channel
MLRLLRVFRVLKLARYVGASAVLAIALRNSRHKIVVFLEVVITLVVIMGSLMYLIEGPEHGFDNIPRSIYWAIVTLTTVGYGDIAPQTFMGQSLASVIMIIGYAIIAVPTGIISVEMSRVSKTNTNTRVCENCHCKYHDDDAKFCKSCGVELRSSGK